MLEITMNKNFTLDKDFEKNLVEELVLRVIMKKKWEDDFFKDKKTILRKISLQVLYEEEFIKINSRFGGVSLFKDFKIVLNAQEEYEKMWVDDVPSPTSKKDLAAM
jgi:hypothetical protein